MAVPPFPEEADRRLGARSPQWADMRLQHRWPPAKVLIWHARAFPAEPRPSQRTLYRFLESQSKEVVRFPLVVAGAWQKRLPLVLVLERQAEALEAFAMRIGRALAQEEKLQGFMLPEVRENVALYFKALQAHFQTQQEMGLVPALRAEFMIRLPVTTDRPPVEPAPRTETVVRRRVVVIEDNDDRREVLVTALAPMGHEVQAASTGENRSGARPNQHTYWSTSASPTSRATRSRGGCGCGWVIV